MQVFRRTIFIFLSDIVAIIYFTIKKLLIFLKINTNQKKLRILLYHSISADSFYKDLVESNVKLDMFRQQMQILRKTFGKIMSLTSGIEDLEKRQLSQHSVAVTFDDGTLNVYNEALKILEDLNIPATFFVIYKCVDSDKEFSESDVAYPKGPFMDWHMVFSLKEKGFEIGSHSYSHKRLNALEDEELHREIEYAKQKFEEKGITVDYFAYPYGFYGHFSEKIEAFIKEAGYKACLTNIMGNNSSGDNLFRLKRTRISWRDNPFRFKMKINGAYDWIDTIKYRLSLIKK